MNGACLNVYMLALQMCSSHFAFSQNSLAVGPGAGFAVKLTRLIHFTRLKPIPANQTCPVQNILCDIVHCCIIPSFVRVKNRRSPCKTHSPSNFFHSAEVFRTSTLSHGLQKFAFFSIHHEAVSNYYSTNI